MLILRCLSKSLPFRAPCQNPHLIARDGLLHWGAGEERIAWVTPSSLCVCVCARVEHTGCIKQGNDPGPVGVYC